MVRVLDIEEIEKLEFVHLERIRYNFLDNINEIIDGLNSRLAIRSDWYEQFVGAKKRLFLIWRWERKGFSLCICP